MTDQHKHCKELVKELNQRLANEYKRGQQDAAMEICKMLNQPHNGTQFRLLNFVASEIYRTIGAAFGLRLEQE
jgi:hypothetical protein